ncbi:hypothetical protein K492DRAFT_200402 [Lichtheimia hyalospora FSU 10163]|nr:hypothetical protein K492DRAFT_200402 [Lichtheimia hyalospora FSU 10163]
MNFKLSLFVTLVIGTLTVLAQPPPAGMEQTNEAPAGDTQQGQGSKTDIGSIATDNQKWTCFAVCNNEGTKAAEGCYEKCLKDEIAASKAGTQEKIVGIA